MCKAVDVASYILQEKGRLSGYQLQKLLYYSQAWCLVTQGRALFDDKVLAWRHGPVVYSVFSEHAGQKTIVSSDLSGDPSSLSPADSVVVDAVLASYSQLSGDELEALSHSEPPWASVSNGVSSLHSPEITAQSMIDYYSILMASDVQTRLAHHVPTFTYAERQYVSEEEIAWLSTLI